MKTGLILEGGAMRGMFTAGVMDVLMENGVTFDGAVGTSAGAAFGCNYKSHQIGRVIRYNTRYCKDKRFCSISSLIKSGDIYNADFCYGDIPSKYDIFDFDTYKNDPMEFYSVCTDIETGKAVYHKYTGDEDSGFDWIRASASMPLVSKIVEIDGKKLLDGGMADSIPLKFFESIGYDRNVVVLTQPADYRKKPNGAMPLIRIAYRKYPKLVEAMANRHTVYNDTIDYINSEEKTEKLLVIRPENPLPVSRMEKDPEKLKAAYNEGRKSADQKLDAVRKFLNK